MVVHGQTKPLITTQHIKRVNVQMQGYVIEIQEIVCVIMVILEMLVKEVSN
jgi:hypothetical protein